MRGSIGVGDWEVYPIEYKIGYTDVLNNMGNVANTLLVFFFSILCNN